MIFDALPRPDELLDVLILKTRKKEKREIMLEEYIRQMSEFFNEPVELVVHSDPVRKYAEALGLKRYLEKLKRNVFILKQ